MDAMTEDPPLAERIVEHRRVVFAVCSLAAQRPVNAVRRCEEQQAGMLIVEFAADLAGSRKTGDLIRTQLLPQSEALLRSGIAGYGLGKAELADVLRAEHDLANLRIELLNKEFDQQRQLAMIERLIGGDL